METLFFGKGNLLYIIVAVIIAVILFYALVYIGKKKRNTDLYKLESYAHI